MDHHNLVAALEVKNKPPAKTEIFGAAAHGDELLPVTPVQPDCEAKFAFDDNGGIGASDAEAAQTITLLKLDHATLAGWRRGAITGFFPTDEQITRAEIERRVQVLTIPSNEKLPEFSFCIRSYALSLLG
jgi:hypothetical protein